MANILGKVRKILQVFSGSWKKTKKNVGVLSGQAKINNIFAKEARESYIKVIQDDCSFSCILQKICYIQLFLMDQLLFRKTHLFFQYCSKFSKFSKILLILSPFTANLRCFATFEKVQGFNENLSNFVKKSSSFSRVLRKLPISVACHSEIATFSHFELNSVSLENSFNVRLSGKLMKV